MVIIHLINGREENRDDNFIHANVRRNDVGSESQGFSQLNSN